MAFAVTAERRWMGVIAMTPDYRDGWTVGNTDYMPQRSECGAKMDEVSEDE